LLPLALLIHRNKTDGLVVPSFLGPEDHPWLDVLVAERSKMNGRPEREWTERLRDPLPAEAPASKVRLAVYALGRLPGGRPRLPVVPRKIRAALFTEAVRDPALALARAASSFGVEPALLERDLFADLPGERPLPALPVTQPAAIAARCNQLLAEGFLSRAVMLRIEVEDDLAGLARWARRRGLLCTLHGDALELSGPFRLFRNSVLYGRTLLGILPLLRGARFRLESHSVLGPEVCPVEMTDADPPFIAGEAPKEPAGHERLAAEISRRAPGWSLTGSEALTLASPSGAVHPIEIVGFWTPKTLRERAAAAPGVTWCADPERNCSEEAPPGDLPVIWFHRRLDAERLIRFFEGREVGMTTTSPT
jgi:predicted nuclease of restriction endonuclease-like RecB superfamily